MIRRDVYQVKFRIRDTERTVFLAVVPMYESGKSMTEGQIVEYGVILLNERGLNEEHLFSAPDVNQAVLRFKDTLSMYYVGATLLEIWPVVVNFETGEISRGNIEILAACGYVGDFFDYWGDINCSV